MLKTAQCNLHMEVKNAQCKRDIHFYKWILLYFQIYLFIYFSDFCFSY